MAMFIFNGPTQWFFFKKPVEKDSTVNIESKVGTPRPIIPSFINLRTCESVRQARMKLNEAYGIGEDLPYEIRSARKSVVDQLKKYKAEGKKATILYPCRLLVDGVTYMHIFSGCWY